MAETPPALPQRTCDIFWQDSGLLPLGFLHKGKPSRFPKIPWPFPFGSPDSSLAVSELPCGSWWTKRKGAFPAPPLLLASQDVNAVLSVHLFHVFPARDTPRVDSCFVGDVFALDGIVGDTHPLPHSFLFAEVEPGFCFNP